MTVIEAFNEWYIKNSDLIQPNLSGILKLVFFAGWQAREDNCRCKKHEEEK